LDKLVIEGGVPLKGEVRLDGAKNAALPALAASLLPDKGTVRLQNVPQLADVRTMCKFLEHMGASLAVDGTSIEIIPQELKKMEAPYDLVRTMRASVLLLGPLLARYGRAHVSFPGGCAIGARPINLHLAGFEAMGAEITLQEGYIQARAERLRGADIDLEIPTVTGTENLLMAASLAEGRTSIRNAAREPEIVDLADFLNAMGAKIRGAGTSQIDVQGVSRLKGTSHRIVPDRIEAATYAVASVMTHGDLCIRGARAEHLSAVFEKMREADVSVQFHDDMIRVSADGQIRGVNMDTAPFPGFPTDVQAQFMALMCLAKGKSRIRESVFENRFMHVAELRRMGADIRCKKSVAQVRSVPFLEGAPVMATDLRASASLVLAGLAARGKTQVRRIYHLDRGYSRLEDKLARVGARIKRIKE